MRISLDTMQNAMKAHMMVAGAQQQVGALIALDESEADQRRDAPGEVKLADAAAVLELSFDPTNPAENPITFKSETLQDAVGPDGAPILKGTQSSYHRDKAGVEHFQTTVPQGDGTSVVQTLAIDAQQGFVDYNEFNIRL